MSKGILVTGTDTGVGKTLVACGLAAFLKEAGYKVGVMKPAETGCDAGEGKLVPQDPNDEPASELLKRITAEREQRAREAAAAKRLNGHQPRRAAKPRGKVARAKATKKATEHGRIADR